MIQIRKERPKVESGEYSFKDNPLINSPHTLEMVSSPPWNFSYSRERRSLSSRNTKKG